MLAKTVSNICKYLEDNDTLENYINVMKCCSECFKLADWSYLKQEEIHNINKGINIWFSNVYDSKKLEFLYLKTARNKATKKKEDTYRLKILDMGVSLLISYEHWDSVFYRPYMLEYFVDDLLEANINEISILSIISKYYNEVISPNTNTIDNSHVI